MNNEDITTNEPVELPTNEELKKLFEKRTQDILFEFNDEIIALETEIKKAKEESL